MQYVAIFQINPCLGPDGQDQFIVRDEVDTGSLRTQESRAGACWTVAAYWCRQYPLCAVFAVPNNFGLYNEYLN